VFDGVAPSGLGTQPVGETACVADGVYQLKLPVPLPLRFVSVYMIEGGDGWTIVDTGFDYPDTYEVWKRRAARVGCDLTRDVARIVVTHFHPDHLGGARWLQERSGAPVYMLEEEISQSRKIWGDSHSTETFIEHLVLHGMDRRDATSAAGKMRTGLRLPKQMLPLHVGEKLDLRGSAARVIRAPGHADNQLMLHDERRKILYAADHILLEITPNIGLWPETQPHPLARYMESLEALRGLEADLVLPGHGPVFHDLDGRIEELGLHHEERLDTMHATLEEGPKTAFAVSRLVFRGALTLYQRCFALTETLAHLDFLALQGRAEPFEDGSVAYRCV
jgi:glyoxylase-like metal-dependent hydrolase (beta-lactamase superfamily II)